MNARTTHSRTLERRGERSAPPARHSPSCSLWPRSPRARRRPSRAAICKSATRSAYCKLLTSYDKKQNAATKALETPGAAVAAMELAYKNLKNEENVVLGIAPSSLQSSYKTVFKDINTLYGDLAKVHFNYLKLSKAQIASFEALSKSMSTASAKITAYNKNVCGVKT